MPLVHSSSDSAFKTNVAEMIRAGHPRDQSLAAAYRVKHGKANGGVAGFAFGGAPMPPQMPQLPPQAMQNVAGFAPQAMPFMHRGFALGGAPAPWYARAEARSMLHSGPIMSAVPGRTDKHNVNVGAGSYVFPASHVSHLGENNTLAGFASLNHMFSSGGPYGASAMKLGHGPGAPKPPRGKFARGGLAGDTFAGSVSGNIGGDGVPIVVAGGEWIATPEQVMRVAMSDGSNDLSVGHQILDAWVNSANKAHIKTLQNLPPPAKK